jgi:hypothetical protein
MRTLLVQYGPDQNQGALFPILDELFSRAKFLDAFLEGW